MPLWEDLVGAAIYGGVPRGYDLFDRKGPPTRWRSIFRWSSFIKLAWHRKSDFCTPILIFGTEKDCCSFLSWKGGFQALRAPQS